MDTHSLATLAVGVVGASGYTGRELLQVLARHDGVDVRLATSRSEAGAPTGFAGLRYSQADPAALDGLDVVFLGLPHGAAAYWADQALATGARVVDLTGDHRPGSGRSEGAVYGLTELAGGDLAGAELVANPGCYPTGVILALAPLQARGLIDLDRQIVVAAASGTTGAGRTPKRDLLFSEVAGDFRAYALGNTHRHLREMAAALPGADLLFVPHLLPVPRGILETIVVPLVPGASATAAVAAWTHTYAGSPVIEVFTERSPSLKDVVGTDRVVLSAAENVGGRRPSLTVVAALDNLGKGAAGQAVQNMNVMVGFEPAKGLRC